MDDVIIFQVTVTSLKKEGLDGIEIWEMPGEGLEIINCSYPIKTSGIYQLLDYEKSDKSELKDYDIENIKQIIYELRNSNKPCILRINDLLSSTTRNHLKDFNYSEWKLKSELLNDFNRILNNNTYLDLNASFFSPSPIILNDEIDYWIDSSEYEEFVALEDYRLIKRRLLELAFLNDSKR